MLIRLKLNLNPNPALCKLLSQFSSSVILIQNYVIIIEVSIWGIYVRFGMELMFVRNEIFNRMILLQGHDRNHKTSAEKTLLFVEIQCREVRIVSLPSTGKTVALHHRDFSKFKVHFLPKNALYTVFTFTPNVDSQPKHIWCVEMSLVLHWSYKANLAIKHTKLIATR